MRIFKPEPGKLLYHYCSAQTLMAVLGNRTLRFSDINMMNDSLETRWGYQVFEEAATRLLRHDKLPAEIPRLPKEFFDAVDDIARSIQLRAHPFIACFTHDPDSLEQWRAYGDDGRGFAIAFSSEKLGEMPATMFEVLYDYEEQVLEVMAVLLSLHGEYEKMKSGEDDEAFSLGCSELGVLFAAYKHPSFRSEREVRLVHAMQLEKTPKGGRRFRDPGGERGSVVHEGQKVGFYVRDGHLTAHVDLPMQFGEKSPVEAVITGPKNYTNTGNLLLYLASEGLDDIRFGRSIIPYR